MASKNAKIAKLLVFLKEEYGELPKRRDDLKARMHVFKDQDPHHGLERQSMVTHYMSNVLRLCQKTHSGQILEWNDSNVAELIQQYHAKADHRRDEEHHAAKSNGGVHAHRYTVANGAREQDPAQHRGREHTNGVAEADDRHKQDDLAGAMEGMSLSQSNDALAAIPKARTSSGATVVMDEEELRRRILRLQAILGPKAAAAIHVQRIQEWEVLTLCHPEDTRSAIVADCQLLPKEAIMKHVAPLLSFGVVTKVGYDVAGLAFLCDGAVRRVFDIGLAAEILTGNILCTPDDLVRHLGIKVPTNPALQFPQLPRGKGGVLTPAAIDALVFQTQMLCTLHRACTAELRERGLYDAVVGASERRISLARETQGRQPVSFDAEDNFRLSSQELLETLGRDTRPKQPVVESKGIDTLLDLLPEWLRVECRPVFERHNHAVTDIILDVGRRPQLMLGEKRHFLFADEGVVVERADLETIVENIGGEEAFGDDNRAGLDQSLHRISIVRNRRRDVVGVTMRVGRYVANVSHALHDILFGMPDKSILVLGEPGSGKTTLIRDIARILAESQNVCVVDTSNEIAGDGDVPHPCLGHARRFMVPSLNVQGNVMIECVQNHTPHVMVIDEIGRQAEVDAACTVRQRGVRLVASAHGDLKSLQANRQLRALLGNYQSVILPGGVSKQDRVTEPAFDVVVELRRGQLIEYTVVMDVAEAVDRMLNRDAYTVQRRSYDPETSRLFLAVEGVYRRETDRDLGPIVPANDSKRPTDSAKRKRDRRT